ncbi:hypothetical protein [uncultured Alcanivorax sp.]|uniref:hypothetical protein n=1 Tax=uncultured Alcanivorax sp. TaxID=191215 RepID=UPI00262388FD|nr:hypothetical protein [uncultured Alcanivorax sp.]
MIDQLSQWIESHQLLVISIFVPLLSAFFAAASSWYTARKALKKEHLKMKFDGVMKIANYRQAWINTLRDEMAEFQSYGVLPDSDPTRERDFYRLGTKIELLMNPGDPDYEELQNYMYNFLLVSDGGVIDKYSKNAEFVELCQKILKREWDRLKLDIEKAVNPGVLN